MAPRSLTDAVIAEDKRWHPATSLRATRVTPGVWGRVNAVMGVDLSQ